MKQTFKKWLLLVLTLLSLVVTQTVKAQSPPGVYTALSSGSQTLYNDTVTGTYKWYQWTADTGVAHIGVQLIKHGTSHQLAKAELYTVNSGTLVLMFSDTLLDISDNTLNLYAGYISAGTNLYIKVLNATGSCTTCAVTEPVITLDVENIMAGCNPVTACDMVKNGGFESSISFGCGIDVTDGSDCWNGYENSTDVYRRYCSAGSWFSLGSSTSNSSPPFNSHNGSPNNAIIGQFSIVTIANPNDYYYTESLQSLLTTPLVPGRTYSLSCWLYNYSGQILSSAYANPATVPCWITFATSGGSISSPSANTATNSVYPGGATPLVNFSVTPINSWTQYTYTFTFSGSTNSNLLVGPNMSMNLSSGWINHTSNKRMYNLIDDVSLIDISAIGISGQQNHPNCDNNLATYTLTASGSTTGHSYTWSPGGSVGNSIIVTPTATTVYSIQSTNPSGCSTSSLPYTITIQPSSQGTIAATASTICPGTAVTLTVSGTNFTPVMSVWSPSPCSPSCVTSTVTLSPTVTTTYTVHLENPNGCDRDLTTTITVLTPTNAITVSGNTLLCTGGQSTTLTATGGSNYTWTPGAITSATIAMSPTVTTTYTVIGTYTCGGTATTVVTVSVTPPPTLTITATPSVLCAGQSSTLTAAGALSYTWNPGALTGNSIVITPTATSTTYTLTGQSLVNCSGTKTISIAVNASVKGVITPSVSTICPGASVVLTGPSTPTATSYAWNTGPTTQSISVSPTITTIYTLTATNIATGCISVKTATVNVTPLNVTVNSATICSGTSVVLTAGGASTYSWSTGPTTSSISVSPTVTTNYTVTGTGSGCINTAVSNVAVISSTIPAFSIITSSTSPVINNGTGTNTVNLSSSISSTTGLSFYWMPNGAFTPTTALSLTQPEIISLTVTHNGCGTISTQSICVNYVAANCANSYSVLNNAIITSTASLATGTVTYFVTGTLTINFTSTALGNALENKTFLMSTGSKVEILPTTNMIINNTRFYSCDGMWQGIELLSNGSSAPNVTMSGEATSIEDAYRGLYHVHTGTNSLPRVWLEELVTFNKNYYDVYVENTNNAAVPYPYTITSNRWLSQSSTTSPGGNLKCSGYYSPTVKSRGYAGLYALNAGLVTFSVNANPADYNQIKNKDYGVYFYNTNGVVNNVTFSDALGIQDNNFGSLPYVPRGVGVYSENSNYVNIKPASTPTTGITTNFTNLGYGVVTKNTYTVDVQNTAHINTTQTLTTNPITGIGVIGTGLNGIYVTDPKGLLRVFNNTFNQTYYPVTVNYSVAPTSSASILSVVQNTMATTTSTGVITTGVILNSAVTFTTIADNMRVAANTFSNVEIGVKTTNMNSGLSISTNTILLKTHVSLRRNGVYLAGSNTSVVVANNQIAGGYTLTTGAAYSYSNVGVFCENSTGCKIKCNSITQTGYGVEYRGGNSSPGDGLFGNTLTYPMRRGLVLSNGGLMGVQGNSVSASANVWVGFTNIAQIDQTWVGGPTTASNGLSSPLWVRNTSTELPTDNAYLSPSGPTDRFNFSAYTLSSSAPTYTPGCPATITTGLKMSSQTANNDDRDADFVRYINTILPSSNADMTPQDKFMLKQFMFESLSEEPSTDATLVNFYAQQNSTSINTYYDIDSLLTVGDINSANTKNAGASTTNDITQTQNEFNALYLSGINNQSDLSSLTALADLCPSQYGNAVYQARALLQTITFIEKQYTDSCYTEKLSSRMGYNEEEEKSISVSGGVQAKLYPNPNNGTFSLAYDLNKNTQATVQIIDVTGKLVYLNTIDNLDNTVQINTNYLQSGIYFIQLLNNNSLLWTDKLMISK